MSIYIKNATYIDWQSLDFTTTDILVEEGRTGGISLVKGLSADDPNPSQPIKPIKTIDAKGKFVTKSFGCGHHHIYSTLARGMPAPAATPQNFVDILKLVWWHVDKNLDLEMIRASALAAGLYCA
ncbi:MAG: amidohydrolase, partial [Desulforhopalus sp.]|nr:amidohydrolase [Desulforhopalus sp.]